MMKRIFGTVALMIATAQLLSAQSLEEGVSYYYYERYNSAKETLEKLVASNPDKPEPVYWLGQTLLQLKDSTAAAALYSKTLERNGNAPLLLVGMGEIELMQGKTNDARQRFETAISLTKGKNVDIYNAIGRANVDAWDGDMAYAIEKLNQATQTRNFKDPETYVLMGDAYRRLIDGGNAVTSYNKALSLDPKLAEAKYKIGKVYLTQKNADYFLPAFEEAIQMDPKYAPAYYELYYYWYFKDVNKSADYFDKYLAVADKKPSDDYDRISIIYARKKFDEAIAAAKAEIAKQGKSADPRYYKLVAYCYDELKDSVNARNYLDQYFAAQKPQDFVPLDYAFKARVLAKFPGNESQAFQNFDKAIALDTSLDGKLSLMNDAVKLAQKMGDKKEETRWLGIVYNKDPKSTKTDLYNWGYAAYQAEEYQQADTIFGMYESKYPDEIYGPLWRARSNQAIDTTMELGLAVPHYQRFIQVAKATDSVKYKSLIVSSLFYLASYSNDIKKDRDAAIDYLTQITYIDPSNDQAPKFIDMLKKAPKQPAGKSKSGNAASAGSGTSSGKPKTP